MWETDQSSDKMIREGSVYLFCVPPLFYPVALLLIMVGEPNLTISHKNKNAKTPGIEDSRFLLDAGLDE
jgi:hypothetical protein